LSSKFFISLSNCFKQRFKEDTTTLLGFPKTASSCNLFFRIVLCFVYTERALVVCRHYISFFELSFQIFISTCWAYSHISFESLLSVLSFDNFIWINRLTDKGFSTDTLIPDSSKK